MSEQWWKTTVATDNTQHISSSITMFYCRDHHMPTQQTSLNPTKASTEWRMKEVHIDTTTDYQCNNLATIWHTDHTQPILILGLT